MSNYKKYVTVSSNWRYAAVKITLAMHPGGKQRKEKQNPTTDSVRASNQRAKTYEVWGLIVSNFEDWDHFICFTHEKEGTSEEDGKRLLKNFMRRLKRACDKSGIEVKAIWTTERGKESGRIHHHMIMNKEVPRELIKQLWQHGNLDFKVMNDDGYNKDGYWSLAEYMVKKSGIDYCRETDLNKQAYSRTRNLKPPHTKMNYVKKQEVTAPKGYEVIESSVTEYTDKITGLVTLEYRLRAITPKPRKNWHRGKKVPIKQAYPITRDYIEEQLSLF